MSARKTKPKCPLCDSKHVELRQDVTTTYRYLKKTHTLTGQEHMVCLDCGLDYFADGQIERNNERFLAFAKTIVKDIAPWEIHEIREKYLISQEDANRIFNCGSATQFSKWERGECAPTGTAALTLLEALHTPSFMKKLADKAGVKIDIPAEDKPSSYITMVGKTSRHLKRKPAHSEMIQGLSQLNQAYVWAAQDNLASTDLNGMAMDATAPSRHSTRIPAWMADKFIHGRT